MNQGNLSGLLEKGKALSTEKIQIYIVQLVRALNWLHSKKMFHGSLKPRNILIFDGDVIKICDFGLVQIIWKTNKDLQQTKGTLRYMSPEMLSSGYFSCPTDLWSVGIVLYELLGGTFPNGIHAGSASVIAWHYRDILGNKPLFQGLPESRRDLERLVIRLLQKNAADRSLEWPEFLGCQIVPETSNDVDAMDQPLRTNTAGVGACDTARPEGVQLQDLNENTSDMDAEFYDALAILLSLKDKLLRNEDVLTLNYSLDTISKVVDVDAFASTRVLNESFLALKDFTIHLIGIFKPDYYDILVKCLLVVKKVLPKPWYGDSNRNYWIDIVDFYRKVAASCAGEAELARIERESSACIIVILSRVAQDAPEDMLANDKPTVVINTLLSCLAAISKSYVLDKLKFLPVACEASKAIWSLLREECKQIVQAVTKALLSDKAVLYGFYICLRNGLEDTQISVIRIILRCCTYDMSVGDSLCHLPSSSHVKEVVSGGGGGNGTIVSLIFYLLSLYARDPETVLTNEICHPVDFIISDLCLVLATIAQSLHSLRRTSAESMLTSSRKVQRARLSVLVPHLSTIYISLTPSVMLALASIFSLESSRTSSFSEIVWPLIPKSATLCGNLRAVLTEDGIESKLSTLQACMDGTVGLLVARLKWGRDSAIQQFCETLIDLVGGNIHSSDNQIGLSPVGVLWILSLLNHCLGDCGATMFELSCTNKYIKFMSGLISDVHLELIKRWGGLGGGKNGVRYIVDAVTGLLESPLAALKDACGNGKKRDIMQTYIESLLKVGIPGRLVKCLEDVEIEDAARPVAFLARMTHHRSVIVQILDKGLFHPITMKRLLGTSSPIEVILNILKIVSDIATMDKVYYEDIKRADILPFLLKFLTHEDPKMRMQVCSTICHMCLHGDYFYDLLEKHKIVPLLVACYSDQATDNCYFAGAAIAAAALHGELLYEEVGRCIPQLTKSLFSAEEGYITKSIACRILRTLVRKSSTLCQGIISNGALEALIILVEKCLRNPFDQPEDEEKSLLDISLETLEDLCKHSSCRKYFHSSAHYLLIERACSEATESKVAASVSHISNKTVKKKVSFAAGE